MSGPQWGITFVVYSAGGSVPLAPGSKAVRSIAERWMYSCDLPFGDRCRGVRPGCAWVTGSSRWVGCSTATA